MLPRSLLEKDPDVIIPEPYTSVPNHVNHTTEKARKKPLHSPPLPKSRVLRSSSMPQQIEKGNHGSLKHWSAIFERDTATNLGDNNSPNDDVVNAVTNKEPPLKVTNHPNLKCVTTSLTGNKVFESAERDSSTQNVQALEGSDLINPVETSSIDIQRLIDEAILKPVLSHMNLEWCLKLFAP